MSPRSTDEPLDPYSAETESAVRYLPVTMSGEIIGYLWASDTDDGISFIRRLAASQDTYRAAEAWSDRLDQAEAEGLTPLQALRRWVGEPEDPDTGGIAADAVELWAPDLRTLNELANPGHVEPPLDSDFLPDGTPMDRSQGWEDLSPFSLDSSGYYPFLTESAVRYLPVTRRGEVLGYLWASETDDAAEYVERWAADADGFHAGGLWRSRLNQAKKEGMTPLEALRRWVGQPEDPEGGGIAADAMERGAQLQALQELADGSDEEG